MNWRLALGLLVTGCVDGTAARWQLGRDRIVAVRMEPPHIAAGQIAGIVGLLASEGGLTTEAEPLGASAPFAPGGLFTAVHFNIDHWQIDGQTDAQLAAARAELGLPPGAPVPIDVTLEFADNLYANKLIFLGDARANPDVPAVAIAGASITSEVAMAVGATVSLDVETSETSRVRWLTSCGSLAADQGANATLHADEPCQGELALVVRDDQGGVAWRVWPVNVSR